MDGQLDTDNVDDLLPQFLRSLAEKIENKEMKPRELQHVGEFFMSYLFEDQVEADNGSKAKSVEMDDKDFKKFLILGWWCYTQIPKMTVET